MQDIKDLTLEELQLVFKEWGQPAFRSRQVAVWIYQKKLVAFDRMTDLPFELRRRLAERFFITGLKVGAMQRSKDGTEKFLLELEDKNCVETVSIPAAGRVTGCVSTQVGCRFACRFCASGLSGFQRNLGCGEIVEQALYLKDRATAGKLTHLVFMGTGEPLDNYDNVFKAIRLINADYGLHIGSRRMTISTCGVIPGIRRMAEEGLQVELSVSLHAADDRTRSRIMPVNKRYPLAELIAACREYYRATRRQVTFEYLLVKGLNSDLHSAARLGTILAGFDSKVNLIPANPVKELGIVPPERPEIILFRDTLVKAGIKVTLRASRGGDIDAACGQLRIRTGKA